MANILIIGGGVAGLSAGIYAQMDGHRAVICEKQPVAGGNLTGWRRGDCRIDNCIHWLTGTNPASPLYKMWVDLGALGDGVAIHRADSLYTCEKDGETLSLWRDLDRLERTMIALSPDDRREIRRMTRAIRAIQDFCSVGGPDHNGKMGPGTLGGIPQILRYNRMTTGDLAKRFRHPLIRAFLTDFLTDRFSSLAYFFVAAHFCGDNADIPVGGSVPMAERMVARFRELGGELLTGKEAVRIRREGDRATAVEFRDGTVATADEIVVTTDPATVFPALLDCPMPKGLAARYRHPRMMRFSSWHCAFVCDRPDEVRFSGDAAWEPSPAVAFRLGSPTVLLRELSHDPGSAPAGKCLLQTMIPCDEDAARRFIDLRKDPAAYARRKQYLAKWTARAIAERFPALEGHLTCLDVWTPATYQRYVGSEIGSFMSFAFGARVLPLRASDRVPGVVNVTLATQWLRAPGGLPIAAESGMKAIRTITARYRRALRRERKALPPTVAADTAAR